MVDLQETREILHGAEAVVTDLLPALHPMRSEVVLKEDGTPVTSGDVLVQERLEEYLSSQIDGLTFIGEEGVCAAEHHLSGWTAVVDPIDGTENFTSGLPEWGTSIALWYEGAHAASMIALPELGLRLVTGDQVEYSTSRITAFSSGMEPALVEELSKAANPRLMGAAVYNLYGVITGKFARFINPVGAYSWDLLAGLSLALEHDCEVYLDDERYDGSYLEPGRKYRVDIRR